MNSVIFFFGSGAAFFVAAGLGLAAAVVSRRRVSGPLAVAGLALAGLSAVPVPYGFTALATVATLARLLRPRNIAVRASLALVWFPGVALELPWQVVPAVEPVASRRLTLIGDSVAAGTGEPGVVPWPRRVADALGLELDDRSRVGATTASALRRIDERPVGDGIVLVEIGGNDLLGGTAAADFEASLDDLLARVSGPGRSVLMLELPLPPFANEFGRAQRRMAVKHGVALVPRRVFAAVISADGATSDGIHLTDAGHALMAEAITTVLRPAVP